MKPLVIVLVLLAGLALQVEGGRWRHRQKPTTTAQTTTDSGQADTPSPQNSSSSAGLDAVDGESGQLLVSGRSLGLWPSSLLTFLSRAGPWSMNVFQVYFLHLGDVSRLIEFANRLDTTFTVQQRCPFVVNSCFSGIRNAVSSSDQIVRIFATSVSNICCGTSYPLPGSSVTTTSAPSGCWSGGQYYSNGQTVPTQQTCQSCACQSGLVRCSAVSCPALSCSNTVQYQGQCCPQCAVTSNTGGQCQAWTAQSQARIVGGTNANQCEFPSLVGIQVGNSVICGGSIIDSRHVLTAAHCIQTSASSYQVLAGKYYTDRSLDEQQRGGDLQIRGVTDIAIHPNFQSRTLANDVAVLTLASDLTWTNCVQRMCLPSSTSDTPDFSSECVVAGWGTTTFRGSQPDVLQKVMLTGYSTQSCYTTFNPSNLFTGVICAAVPQGGMDACQGDSGGIMLCRSSQDGSYKQYGVVSSGHECALPGYPGLYSEVIYHFDFITNRN